MNRSDRTKLEYHRVIADKYRDDKQSVQNIANRNLSALRERYEHSGWGWGGIEWLNEWQRLLLGPEDKLISVCIREDEFGCDMRQVSPFRGVLSEEERRAAFDRARAVQ